MILASIASRRDLARRALLESPDRSDRRLAAETGLSRMCIARIRAGLVASGEIQGGPVLGRDGKVYVRCRRGSGMASTALRRIAMTVLRAAARLDAAAYREASATDRAMLGVAITRIDRVARELGR